MKPVMSLLRIARSRNRTKLIHSKRITPGTPLALPIGREVHMIGRKIQAVVLTSALLLPASPALAKKHSRMRGTIVGAVAGALIGGKKGAVVGAVAGNTGQAARHKQYKKKHHIRR